MTRFQAGIFALLLAAVPLFYGCSPQKSTPSLDEYRAGIIETERAFAAMAASEGLQAAFAAFAAEDAVILRNDRLIRGRAAIGDFYADPRYRGVELVWSPERTEVSACGDLGYTWGSYTFTATDSLGARHRSEGIFHTVWKRQPDGSWKFVWD